MSLFASCGQIIKSVLLLFSFYMVEKSAAELFSWKTKMGKFEDEWALKHVRPWSQKLYT